MPSSPLRHRMTRRLALAGLAGLALPARAMRTDGWRLLVGFQPASSIDRVARMLAARMEARLGMAMAVENAPGEGGRLTLDAVRAAPPEERVLVLTPSALLTLAPHVATPALRYDALAEFTPITAVSDYGFGLAVPRTMAVRNFAEFAGWLRAQTEPVPFKTRVSGSAAHFMGVMLGRSLGVRTVHRPLAADLPLGDALKAVGSPVFIGNLGDLVAMHDDTMRVLAISPAARYRLLPGVPSFAELGLGALVKKEWLGLLGPSGMAPASRDAIHAAMQDALEEPEVGEALERLCYTLAASPSPAHFAERIRMEREEWAGIVRESRFAAEG